MCEDEVVLILVIKPIEARGQTLEEAETRPRSKTSNLNHLGNEYQGTLQTYGINYKLLHATKGRGLQFRKRISFPK